MIFKKTLKVLHRNFKFIGFDFFILFNNLKGLRFFFSDYFSLKKQLNTLKSNIPIKFYPILNERFEQSGTNKGHYFYQDYIVAKKIYENKPQKHIDIGSRIDGFVAHVAVFRKIEVIDIRALSSTLENISFTEMDFMNLPEKFKGYCDSISSLHAIEHFGLGRYSDPIDITGHLKAINNIYNMLLPLGKFYFSVPIGKPIIMFNAHRIFDVEYLFKLFHKKFKIISFNYVDDIGELHSNIIIDNSVIKELKSLSFGCGIFELEKI